MIMNDLISRQAAEEVPSAQPDKTRIFVELIVEYPDQELCPYKEYRGKPYYSIKYIENGERYVGYGTYNPEVLSQYLKEYFMPSAQTERKKGKWIDEKINSYTSRTYCSECGNSAPFICVSGDYYGRNMHGETNKTKFCPHCGARMDGE